MTPSSSPPKPSPKTSFAAFFRNISNDPSHPVQIALRAYSLCLSLSLGPVFLPLIFTLIVDPKRFASRAGAFRRVLSRELRPTGFAPAITIAVGGGAALQRLWDFLERQYTRPLAWARQLSPYQRAFLANAITSAFAVILLRWRRHRRIGTASPTLNLSLLFLVRALDASVQAILLQVTRRIVARQARAPSRYEVASRLPDARLLDTGEHENVAREWQRKIATSLDALIFWAGSARIMWCFFYQPQRLPTSYVKWIGSLANVDKRLLEVLRALREGAWSYIHPSPTSRDIIGSLVEELGRPPSWGDPSILPAYGGNIANESWKKLGVYGRSVGGLPCELVHGGIGATFGLHKNCLANATVRAVYAFAEALAIYLPVHFLPVLLTKPGSILRPDRTLVVLRSAVQSAMFLSSFVSSCWFGVCFTRTLVLARLFPKISHDVWDGPYGGTLVGSLACGASIWIENARRRREMALYVLPKALRASISETWIHSRHPVVQLAECVTFIASLASLLTLSVHGPESLRGLSRGTLTFVMKGPNASFWKRSEREIATKRSTRPLCDSDSHEN